MPDLKPTLTDEEAEKLPTCPRCGSPVYWGHEGGNFYCAVEKKGCGTDFYREWRGKLAKFPTSPGPALMAGGGGGSRSSSASLPSPSSGDTSGGTDVWVLTGSHGEYSDRSEWVEAVFRTEAEGRLFVDAFALASQQIEPWTDFASKDWHEKKEAWRKDSWATVQRLTKADLGAAEVSYYEPRDVTYYLSGPFTLSEPSASVWPLEGQGATPEDASGMPKDFLPPDVKAAVSMTREAHTEALIEWDFTRVIFDAMQRPGSCQPGCTLTRGVWPDCGCWMDAEIIRYDVSQLLAARLATITPEREAVARIVAPEAWALWPDHTYAPVSDIREGQKRVRAPSLAKADQIIALFNTGKAETP